ncbi:hypothetical protein KBY70_04735 [Cyanobium sp. ATX 6E8]|nr:hypothetical protein [Cyanobium sp. ATX 6E8]
MEMPPKAASVDARPSARVPALQAGHIRNEGDLPISKGIVTGRGATGWLIGLGGGIAAHVVERCGPQAFEVFGDQGADRIALAAFAEALARLRERAHRVGHHQGQNETLLLGLVCLQEQEFALPVMSGHDWP